VGIPSPVLVPPGPSWVLVNLDNPISLPVLGQFDPKLEEDRGKPIWQKKPGILGGLAWIKYVGEEIGSVSFEFMAIGTTILDPFPLAAWLRLNELKSIDTTLGRPPRVLFTHGLMVVEGFITNIPDAPMEYWGGDNFIRSRIIRQIGPVRITITRIPKETTEISILTNFIPRNEETKFEELSLSQYGDARYAQTLAIYNQGVKDGQTLEIPRKSSGYVSKVTPVAPALGESIEGL
jgi:hypothetical protein